MASWKAVKIPVKLKNQERGREWCERGKEWCERRLGRDKPLKPCSQREESSCHLKSNP